jgi:transcriptional regulator with XRE-family HTH domain
MSTSEAIVRLRKKLGLNQGEFAKLLGVTNVSISRYEHGQEPASKLLEKLAEVAEQAGATHLYNLFRAKRSSDVMGRQETLSSAGEARRVELWELQYLAETLEILASEDSVKIATRVANILGSLSADEDVKRMADLLPKHAEMLTGVARKALERLTPYLNPDLKEEHKPAVINAYHAWRTEMEAQGMPPLKPKRKTTDKSAA